VKRFEERTDAATGERYLSVFARGAALTEDPVLNKGTCFTRAEREALGLLGLLPPSVQTPDEQLARAYGNYLETGDDVRQYLFLADLQDRNESLFCRLVLNHLPEMVPIIYTPTVGKACEQYSHIYRRARGLYISKTERGRMAEVLRHAAIDDPRVIVLTDNEAILGIGDQGVGGMPIAIGKLALYTVGAGIHPARCLPIDFDAGTDNPARLDDPLYLGARHRRLRGAEYVALLDELVEAMATVFPHALVQWEDFASANAFTVLQRYRRRLLSFNDDIQGTGAVVVAGIRTGLRHVGRAIEDAKIVFFGAGASGAGCALAVRAAMRAAGMSEAEIARRVLSLDSKGLIVTSRPGLDGIKRDIAVDRSVVAGWTPSPDGTFDLATVVRHFAPSVLVGVSGQAGAFTEAIIGDLVRGCPRPIVLALSNPNSRIEATPADLIRWTHGAAVVGTGGPFAPVVHNGTTHTIGQGNNVFIFPGVGLGATAVGAQWLPDDAFSAAADALVECTTRSGMAGAGIYPPLSDLRHISRDVGLAVARTVISLGAAPPLPDDEIRRRVLAGIWEPAYLPYRAG
jgi:malate dehydrogenase (oxaloacetate-decarboxylating)